MLGIGTWYVMCITLVVEGIERKKQERRSKERKKSKNDQHSRLMEWSAGGCDMCQRIKTVKEKP